MAKYRDILGFPGYRVGDDGSVWTCKARSRQGRWGLGTEWRLLKPQLNGSPEDARRGARYLVVGLTRGGKTRTYRIHRLVLEAFVGPCPPRHEACHDPDPTPSNNALTNLRWGTRIENRADSARHRREPDAMACRLRWLRLMTPQPVPSVASPEPVSRAVIGDRRRALRARMGLSQAALATAAGVGRRTVCRAEEGDGLHEANLRRLAAALGVAPWAYLDPA